MTTKKRDIHILKYFSSFVSVSNGRVINITEPKLAFCPLAAHLYKNFKNTKNSDGHAIKNAIKNVIESKIKNFGFFTDKRTLVSSDIDIPYGASEIIMFAILNKKADCAVLVCDGAGTIVTDNPEIVQGIGARMNTLVLTSPIKNIIDKLKSHNCIIISDNALIDQHRGIREAIKKGYKKIAVTISGNSSGILKKIRKLEQEKNIQIIVLSVCTTGIDEENISQIKDHADLVWSCSSKNVREIIGSKAILQLSKQIPVFVLTKNGLDFIASFIKETEDISKLNIQKQYLISNEKSDKCLHAGKLKQYIKEAALPVNTKNNSALL